MARVNVDPRPFQKVPNRPFCTEQWLPNGRMTLTWTPKGAPDSVLYPADMELVVKGLLAEGLAMAEASPPKRGPGRPRVPISPETRREAVKLALETTFGIAAERFGVSRTTLMVWRNQEGAS